MDIFPLKIISHFSNVCENVPCSNVSNSKLKKAQVMPFNYSFELPKLVVNLGNYVMSGDRIVYITAQMDQWVFKTIRKSVASMDNDDDNSDFMKCNLFWTFQFDSQAQISSEKVEYSAQLGGLIVSTIELIFKRTEDQRWIGKVNAIHYDKVDVQVINGRSLGRVIINFLINEVTDAAMKQIRLPLMVELERILNEETNRHCQVNSCKCRSISPT